MSDSFNLLDEEKRQKIVNAALKEFSQSGYEKASTNKIISSADISKGSLFNYFENKKQLFLYLFDYCEKLNGEYLLDSVDWSEKDFLARLEETMLKMTGFLKLYPDAMEFLRKAKHENSPAVRDEVMKIKKSSTDKLAERMISDIDYSLFKPELELESVFFTIQTTLLALLNEAVKQGRMDSDDTIITIKKYLGFFKTTFYK